MTLAGSRFRGVHVNAAYRQGTYVTVHDRAEEFREEAGSSVRLYINNSGALYVPPPVDRCLCLPGREDREQNEGRKGRRDGPRLPRALTRCSGPHDLHVPIPLGHSNSGFQQAGSGHVL